MIAKDFPGTLFVSIDSMKHFVKDICETLALSGFRKILILDGHGGNPPAMVQVTKEVTEETGAACIYLFWKVVIPRETLRRIIETPTPYNHACEAETSVNLALGNRVLPERAVDAIPKIRCGISGASTTLIPEPCGLRGIYGKRPTGRESWVCRPRRPKRKAR